MKRFRPFSKRNREPGQTSGMMGFRTPTGECRDQGPEQPQFLKITFEKECEFQVPISHGRIGQNERDLNRWIFIAGAIVLGAFLLAGCNFAPAYKRPATMNPTA